VLAHFGSKNPKIRSTTSSGKSPAHKYPGVAALIVACSRRISGRNSSNTALNVARRSPTCVWHPKTPQNGRSSLAAASIASASSVAASLVDKCPNVVIRAARLVPRTTALETPSTIISHRHTSVFVVETSALDPSSRVRAAPSSSAPTHITRPSAPNATNARANVPDARTSNVLALASLASLASRSTTHSNASETKS
jgi:hypothetical protein